MSGELYILSKLNFNQAIDCFSDHKSNCIVSIEIDVATALRCIYIIHDSRSGVSLISQQNGIHNHSLMLKTNRIRTRVVQINYQIVIVIP